MVDRLIAERDSYIKKKEELQRELRDCEKVISIINSLRQELDNCRANLDNCSKELQKIILNGLPFDKGEKLPHTSKAISLYIANIEAMHADITDRISKIEDEIARCDKKINSLNGQIDFWSRVSGSSSNNSTSSSNKNTSSTSSTSSGNSGSTTSASIVNRKR